MFYHSLCPEVNVPFSVSVLRKAVGLILMTFFLRKNSCTPQQAAALTESILNMIVKDMRPLSMVDGEGFREMVSAFNPGYTLPSRTYFSRLMEQKYENLSKSKYTPNAELQIRFRNNLW